MASAVRVEVAEIYKGLRLFQLQQSLGRKLETVGQTHINKDVQATTKVEAVGDRGNLSPLSLH